MKNISIILFLLIYNIVFAETAVFKILEGARAEVRRAPIYHSAYYKDGYPPENTGVCTDLVWRAFLHAGINLKELIDEDIKKNPSEYPWIIKRDPNIDFRRVPNMLSYFQRNASSVTMSLKNKQEWRAGDVVVFKNPNHIGILSDKKNIHGYPYLIHNPGPIPFEEDALFNWHKKGIAGHFRLKKQ